MDLLFPWVKGRDSDLLCEAPYHPLQVRDTLASTCAGISGRTRVTQVTLPASSRALSGASS